MQLKFLGLIVAMMSLAAQNKQTFTGVIADNVCGKDGHARMRMGPTDATCVAACIDAHGAAYVLDTGRTEYALSDQKTPAKFAGQKVDIVGTLDAAGKTIRVESIAAAK